MHFSKVPTPPSSFTTIRYPCRYIHIQTHTYIQTLPPLSSSPSHSFQACTTMEELRTFLKSLPQNPFRCVVKPVQSAGTDDGMYVYVCVCISMCNMYVCMCVCLFICVVYVCVYIYTYIYIQYIVVLSPTNLFSCFFLTFFSYHFFLCFLFYPFFSIFFSMISALFYHFFLMFFLYFLHFF